VFVVVPSRIRTLTVTRASIVLRIAMRIPTRPHLALVTVVLPILTVILMVLLTVLMAVLMTPIRLIRVSATVVNLMSTQMVMAPRTVMTTAPLIPRKPKKDCVVVDNPSRLLALTFAPMIPTRRTLVSVVVVWLMLILMATRNMTVTMSAL